MRLILLPSTIKKLIINIAVSGTNGYFPNDYCGENWGVIDPATVDAFDFSEVPWYTTYDYLNAN